MVRQAMGRPTGWAPSSQVPEHIRTPKGLHQEDTTSSGARLGPASRELKQHVAAPAGNDHRNQLPDVRLHERECKRHVVPVVACWCRNRAENRTRDPDRVKAFATGAELCPPQRPAFLGRPGWSKRTNVAPSMPNPTPSMGPTNRLMNALSPFCRTRYFVMSRSCCRKSA
jgi:hypothetical protein